MVQTVPTIRVLTGDQAGTEFSLGELESTLGRDASATITLEDPERRLSRIHARISRRDDGRYAIEGLGANGTTVGRNRADQRPCVLASGDVITLGGSVRLCFVHHAPDDRPGEVEDLDPAAPRQGRRTRTLLVGGLLFWFVIGGLVLVAAGSGSVTTGLTALTPTALVRCVNNQGGETLRSGGPEVRSLVGRIQSRPDRDDLRRILREAAWADRHGASARARHHWRAFYDHMLAPPGEPGPGPDDQLGARYALGQLERLAGT